MTTPPLGEPDSPMPTPTATTTDPAAYRQLSHLIDCVGPGDMASYAYRHHDYQPPKPEPGTPLAAAYDRQAAVGQRIGNVLAVVALLFVGGLIGYMFTDTPTGWTLRPGWTFIPAAVGAVATLYFCMTWVQATVQVRRCERSEWAAQRISGNPALAAFVGDPTQQHVWEAKLIVATDTIARQIIEHPAWRTDWLDTHRLRLNPLEESEQIAARALELHRIRTELGPRPSVELDHGRPAAVIYRYAAELNLVADALLGRAVALKTYLGHLDLLGALMRGAQSLERADGLTGRISELVAKTGLDTVATTALDGLTEELATVSEGLRAAIAYLAGPDAAA
ncbi:hypothetical protein ABIB25_000935 [Nakamurella sp. UYEF19]|uniref:hypothetical protein n=1 Tax=Nakamurella sp. UYEF19 TaxID=1756392 RepID=UPI003390D153